MAERRMFAKAVIGSGKFLRMPVTARLLYYDLGMEADDDGFVEAFRVMRTTGATEDDLKILCAKGFVRVLNDELVTLICDWNVNNYIQKDRYHKSIYAGLVENMDTTCIQPVYNMDTSGIPTVSKTDTEVRIGKSQERSVQYSEGESVPADAAPAKKRESKKFVPPTVDEVNAYCAEHGYAIDGGQFVDFYAQKGWVVGRSPMKDWKAAVRNWQRRREQSGAGYGTTYHPTGNSDAMFDFLNNVINGGDIENDATRNGGDSENPASGIFGVLQQDSSG